MNIGNRPTLSKLANEMFSEIFDKVKERFETKLCFIKFVTSGKANLSIDNLLILIKSPLIPDLSQLVDLSSELIPHFKSRIPTLDRLCPEAFLKYILFKSLKNFDENALIV